jgi:integrase/recombinase XerC
MASPPPPPAAIPTFQAAVDRFLMQARFAPRTRASYGRDLAPLVARIGDGPITALTPAAVAAWLAGLTHLAPATFNRRHAAVRSLARWCMRQGWLDDDPLVGLERRPQPPGGPRALDPAQVEAVLGGIRDRRDRALFWLLYDGGLRCHEALAIDIEEIDWGERAIRIHGKGGRPRELFFSRRVARHLDDYLKARGAPTRGPLFVTHRRARNPRRADLTPDGHARLSYRQADTRWKGYTPGWDLHQLRHTAISARAARGYTEVELKRFSGHRSLRSLERYIADNREAAKRKAREWERRQWPDG